MRAIIARLKTEDNFSGGSRIEVDISAKFENRGRISISDDLESVVNSVR